MAYTEHEVSADALRDQVLESLDERKGRDIVALAVGKVTDITDYMVIASGTSNRHVKALVDQVVEDAKASGTLPMGVEGRETNEWVLVDLGDVLVHVMQEKSRRFYDLERLWSELPADSESLL
ncbi:MAG: ribosome silencing factor [Gammaproteobacteria bacterium]|nr:ribosome silencing factor [Gammaproteobacteria bacterium]